MLQFQLTLSCILHSVFGEDALVNVSVEKKDDNDGKLAGYIRIRSKTQGMYPLRCRLGFILGPSLTLFSCYRHSFEFGRPHHFSPAFNRINVILSNKLT